MSRIRRIRRILETSPTVAVLGAHHEQRRAAFYVPDYLHRRGYRILPVNPGLVGQELWGEPVRASLTDIDEPVDLVNVFRASWNLAPHIPEVLGMSPLPTVVWLQLGIRSDAFGEAMTEAGIEFVQNRCTLADHRSQGISEPPARTG